MMLIPFLCLGLPLEREIKPFYLEAESPVSSSEYTLALIDELDLNLPARQIANIRAWQKYKAQFETDGAASSKGKIWYLDAESVVRQAHFWTVPDYDHFREFVANEVKLRGGAVTVTGKTQVHISGGSTPSTPDVWVAYADGLCISGDSPTVLRVSVSESSEWANQSKGKHFSCEFRPNALPKKYRNQVVSKIRNDLNVALQARDEEDVDSHSIRRAWALGALSLLDMVSADILSIRAWTEWPSTIERSRFKCGFEIETKAKSRLRSALRSMAVRNTSIAKKSVETLGLLEVHIGVPTMLRAVVEQIPTKKLSAEKQDLWGSFREMLLAGKVEALVVVPVGETSPSVIGGIRLHGDPSPNMTTIAQDFFVPGGLAEFAKYRTAYDTEKGMLRGAFAHEPNPSDINLYLASEGSRSNVPMVQFKLDLSKWPDRVDSGSGSRQVLEGLEQAFDEWNQSRISARRDQQFESTYGELVRKYGKDRAAEVRSALGSRSIKGAFKSAIETSPVKGDWVTTGTLRMIGGKLVGRAEVGFELHRLFRARCLLGAQRRTTSSQSN